MEWQQFFRKIGEQDLFIVPFAHDETKIGLALVTRNLTAPTLEAALLAEIQEKKVQIFHCARFHSVYLCPFPEHKSEYVYRLVTPWNERFFVCPACEEIRRDFIASGKHIQPMVMNIVSDQSLV